jgi:uncharacterized damage-inducible protein DinB
MSRLVFLLFLAGVTAPSAAAQPAPSADPLIAAVRHRWDYAKHIIAESADLMPEEHYAFKPVDTVRTFGQLIAHITGENYAFCALATGEKAPRESDDVEKSAVTKADIKKALDESVAYCDGIFTSLTDKRSQELVDVGGGNRVARGEVLLWNVGHLQEHYGNLVTYFRIKGLVPPTSQPRN